MGTIQFLLVVGSLRLLLLWECNDHSFGMQKGRFCRRYATWSNHEIMCAVRLFKPRRSVSGEFDLTQMLLKTSFSMTVHSHGMKTQEPVIKLGWTVHFHPPYSPDFSLEPSEMQSVGKGLGAMTRLLKVLTSGCKYKIRSVAERGNCSCFLLVQGC